MIYQRILLPVSGKNAGARALKALEHALKLVNGEMVVMHSYEPLSQRVGGDAHTELVNAAVAESMNILSPVTRVIEEAGFPYKTVVVEGVPAESIVKVARDEACDMIVMFTDGRDEVSDLLLGSVTERVLRKTDVPLLAIRR